MKRLNGAVPVGTVARTEMAGMDGTGSMSSGWGKALYAGLCEMRSPEILRLLIM